MKNCKKCSENSMSALKLILIITGSIIAAVALLCMIMKLCKKKHCLKKPVECCCGNDEDTVDSWDIDEDVLDDLILDDDDCGCVECSNPECSSCGSTCGTASDEAAEAAEDSTSEDNE